jgi:hypothetical protein
MSNVLYEDRYYGEDTKNTFFLDMEHKQGTIKIYNRLFKVSRVIEEELDKDLYDFNREDIRRLGFMYMPKTEASSLSNISYISNYIDWAISKKLRRGVNPLLTCSTEWKRQFANVSTKRFWTDREIDKVIEGQENPSDGCIISLLFNGVRGNGNAEILNLHKNSIDVFNNQLHLEDEDGSRRTITVSEKCIKLCLQSLAATDYVKMNGNASRDIKSPIAKISDSLYVVRNALTRTVFTEEADKSIIHRRLSKIASEIGESGFIPLNLSKSGMLSMAKDRYVQNGELTDIDFIEIAIQFGEGESALYRLKNEFLNEQTVKDLYQIP